MRFISGWGTKILHSECCSPPKNKEIKNKVALPILKKSEKNTQRRKQPFLAVIEHLFCQIHNATLVTLWKRNNWACDQRVWNVWLNTTIHHAGCNLPISEDYMSLSHKQANMNTFHVCLPHFKYAMHLLPQWMHCSTFQVLLVQQYYQLSYISIPFLMKSFPSHDTFSAECLGFPGIASLTIPQPLSVCGVSAHVHAAGHH